MDESFQAVKCTGTDNQQKIHNNTKKNNRKTNKEHDREKLSVNLDRLRTAYIIECSYNYRGTQYSTD